MRPDGRGIVGGVLVVGKLKFVRQIHGGGCEFRRPLVLDVDVGFGALFLAHGAVGQRHAVIEHHHVVLDHAEPLRFGKLAGARGGLDALQVLALIDVGARAVQTRLFVVPEGETEGAVGVDVRAAEDAGQFHDERGSGAIVVSGLTPADAVHVRGDNVHLLRMNGTHFGAVDFFAKTRRGGLRVQLAELHVRLFQRIVIDGFRDAVTAAARATRTGVGVGGTAAPATAARIRGRRLEVIADALRVGAAVAFELRFNPVEGGAVAVRALTAIAELRQAFNRGFIAFQIEASGEGRKGIRSGWFRRRFLRDEKGAGAQGDKGSAESDARERIRQLKSPDNWMRVYRRR